MWPLLPRRPGLQVLVAASLGPCGLLRHLDDAKVVGVVFLRQHLEVEGGDDGVGAAERRSLTRLLLLLCLLLGLLWSITSRILQQRLLGGAAGAAAAGLCLRLRLHVWSRVFSGGAGLAIAP